MSSDLFELAFGLLLGFSLTIPPGPMNAYIASQSVRSLREGITTGVGAMSADLALGILVYVAHTQVDLAGELRGVYLLGAAVMIVLGVGLLRRGSTGPPPQTSGARTYAKAFGIGISNPFQIVWWLTAGLAFAYLGGLLLFVGLFGAIAVWIVVFPWLVHAGTEGRPGVARGVLVVSGALFFAFAGYFLFLAI
ncbi:MAG: LysE family translocator [Candidatus Lutacidiplasmatales archaeon]